MGPFPECSQWSTFSTFSFITALFQNGLKLFPPLKCFDTSPFFEKFANIFKKNRNKSHLHQYELLQTCSSLSGEFESSDRTAIRFLITSSDMVPLPPNSSAAVQCWGCGELTKQMHLLPVYKSHGLAYLNLPATSLLSRLRAPAIPTVFPWVPDCFGFWLNKRL